MEEHFAFGDFEGRVCVLDLETRKVLFNYKLKSRFEVKGHT